MREEQGMKEQRHGRRREPLSADLPPAHKRFVHEMRRHVDESGITVRSLAEKMYCSPAQVSRFLRGQAPGLRRQERLLHDLITALELSAAQGSQLTFLHRQAVEEAEGALPAGSEGAVTELAGCLTELRQKSGISLRDISHRLALTGSPVAKSTVERTLDDPDRSPLLALQVALVLLEMLPEDERGPQAERVFRAVLGAAAPAMPGAFALTAPTGSGKTHSALAAFHASRVASSEETVASLARILDLPVAELSALRETTAADQIPGRPISEWNPFELGVHPPAAAVGASHSMEADLPPYIERPHDRMLADSVRDAAGGRSQMLVVTGASSTGKTRACWEAIKPLSEQGWRLWHPFNPSPAEAVLEGLGRVEPRTVVWLDDTDRYLLAPELGEQVAYVLQRRLVRPDRGPILVLGTIWPTHLDHLTAPPPPDAPDLHEHARRLLSGRTIFIPDRFDQAVLSSADAEGVLSDPRLAEAIAQSGANGHLTQYLAAGPALLKVYDNATPAARAVLEAAMDACRLGVSSALSQSFLAEAAIDYFSDAAFDMLTEDWAERAFAELTRPVLGAPGALRRIQPRASMRAASRPAPHAAPVQSAGPAYRLADYLDQSGRRTRQFLCPPDSFWLAGFHHLTAPEDLESLADAADGRYRLKWSNILRRQAAEVSDDQGLVRLTRLNEQAGDREGAERLARSAADAGYTSALRELVRMRAEAGDFQSAELLAQQAAHHGDGLSLAELAWTREEQGDFSTAARLAQDAAAVGDTFALRELARMREVAGDLSSAEELYRQAANLGDTSSLLRLAEMGEEAGARAQAETLARAVGIDGAFPLIGSARLKEGMGDQKGAEALYRQAADAGSPFALAALARLREAAGDRNGAEALYRQTANAGFAWLVNPASRWPHGLDPNGAPTPP
ncbi:hypothetical protein [Streptomyces sasae]|uniref:hypothetical protein n=1 Tax=Streptomyces sasae TaxID=1266772 RepID=UPI00292DBAD1|nr:hypothetical protein [Streptomyces sasae]